MPWYIQNIFKAVLGFCIAIVVYKNIAIKRVQKKDHKLAVVDIKLWVVQALEFVFWGRYAPKM